MADFLEKNKNFFAALSVVAIIFIFVVGMVLTVFLTRLLIFGAQ